MKRCGGSAMRLLLISLPVFVVFFIATSAAPASEDEPKGEDGAIYQIVKATTDRVWRLNKQTGEVAVCSLKGDSLVCTTSIQAATPPTKRKRRRHDMSQPFANGRCRRIFPPRSLSLSHRRGLRRSKSCPAQRPNKPS